MKIKFPNLYPKTKRGWFFLCLRWIILFTVLISGLFFTTTMPGKSYSGAPVPLTESEIQISKNLKNHVIYLSSEIGARNVFMHDKMEAAVDYISKAFKKNGYKISEEPFKVKRGIVKNILAELPGEKSDEIFVVGAHYDTILGTPGANDNGSGVAALLELSRLFAAKKFKKSLRFIAFANEEPPFFGSSEMGSFVSAKNSREKHEKIIGMLSVETIGYFSDKPATQEYMIPYGLIYPDRANFIAFVSNIASRNLLKKFVKTFRNSCNFPSEGLFAPSWIKGIHWSDHWSYWKHGFPAIMVSDTAPFRYKWYHTAHDTFEKLNYDNMARIVEGLNETLTVFVKF